MCCSKFGSYLIKKEDGNLTKNGAGATPKITKLEKKQSFVAQGKEPAAKNGDGGLHKNGDTTASVSPAVNGKKATSSSTDDKAKKDNENIVITHIDSSTNGTGIGGGVTVTTGITTPVDLQPNVSVTPVHSQSSTSYSETRPDANTKIEEVVITKSSVLNEPGHSKIVEETTKTTFISSTSIVNEELHIVESSSKSAAIENGTKVNKTVVEVKGLETKSKKKKKRKKGTF